MERICRECGSLVNGEARFCPVCGKPMERAVDLGKREDAVQGQAAMNVPVWNEVGSTTGYGAPQYGSGGVPQNISNMPRINAPYEHLSTGEWFLTIAVCTFFGGVSLILNIIWGFGATTPEPKRSFCRAMLIVNIVSMVLSFFFVMIIIWIMDSQF